jgi:hypothetical protein
MKTVTAVLALFSVVAGAAAASEPIDVVVVAAKQPATLLLSDMTEEILDDTSAALKANQQAIVAEKVRIELPTIAPPSDRG